MNMITKDLFHAIVMFQTVAQSETAISQPEFQALEDAASVLARVSKLSDIGKIDKQLSRLLEIKNDLMQ